MFKNIFTSYLYTNNCNIDLLPIYNHIIEIKKKDKEGKVVSNWGGWKSKRFNKVNSYTQPLFKILDKTVREIKKKVDCNYDFKLLEYWYNINKEFSFNMPHMHVSSGGSIVSGVFYVKTPKHCGKIVFRRNDPLITIMYDENINKYNEYNSSIWSIDPKENLLVLFPSNMEHFVEPNLNKNNERISISFNYGI